MLQVRRRMYELMAKALPKQGMLLKEWQAAVLAEFPDGLNTVRRLTSQLRKDGVVVYKRDQTRSFYVLPSEDWENWKESVLAGEPTKEELEEQFAAREVDKKLIPSRISRKHPVTARLWREVMNAWKAGRVDLTIIPHSAKKVFYIDSDDEVVKVKRWNS